MAFNNLGDVTFLAQGAVVEYFYFFANFADVGFQQAGADIKPPFGAKVAALDQRKQKLISGQAIYFVLFQNLGPGGVSFNVQGGGGA